MKRAHRVLVLGSGGREHAIAHRCSKDDSCEQTYVLPGNPGMNIVGDIKIISKNPNDFEDVLATIKELNISIVVVGPEVLLDKGIADFLRKNDVPVVGPGAQGTQLESSKAFSKDFMQEFNIPTAAYKNFSNSKDAITAVEENSFGDNPVVKASQLAGGKGVFVTTSHQEAIESINNIFHNEHFSVESNEIVIEENLKGLESSAFALYDGKSYLVLGYASDYKRLKDGDIGPNTGGMGTWTPEGFPNSTLKEKVNKEVFDRVLVGLKQRGIEFKGILFAGLMINNDEVNVIEFNVRLGDPETQVILPLIKGDFTQALFDSANGELSSKSALIMDEKLCAVHIVKVSQNYPSLDGTKMLLNQKIEFDKNWPLSLSDKEVVFFAGVKEQNDVLVNSGGRVLGVTVIAESTNAARERAYQLIENINFEGQYYRNDIAKKQA